MPVPKLTQEEVKAIFETIGVIMIGAFYEKDPQENVNKAVMTAAHASIVIASYADPDLVADMMEENLEQLKKVEKLRAEMMKEAGYGEIEN